MFHEGDLQSGIAVAMESGKQIVCFVGDDNQESKSWEAKLREEGFANILSSRAVTLKLVQGSPEAGYLTPFVTIQEVPAIVFLGTGAQLGVKQLFSKSTGINSIDQAIGSLVFLLGQPVVPGSYTSTSRPPASSPQSTVVTPLASTQTARSQAIDSNLAPVSPTTSHSSQPTTQPASSTSNKKGKQRAVSPAPEPEANPNALPGGNSSGKVEVQNWAQLQRQRNAQAKLNRDRVLAQIELDKRARKEREASRKRELAQEAEQSTPLSSESKGKKPSNPAALARIQVRLLSGATIRKEFKSSTPASSLRPWIDKALREEGQKSIPAYKLKHIPGPPEPARTIDVGDEQSSLLDLGLLPSATLVVDQISGSVDAYGNGGPSWRLIDVPVTAVGLVAGAIGGALGWATGWGGSSQNDGSQATAKEPVKDKDVEKKEKGEDGAGKTTGRIRTIAELRADSERESTQLYNGNQLNFQSDENDEDK